jgi:ribulose-phosphate 3-epimerase
MKMSDTSDGSKKLMPNHKLTVICPTVLAANKEDYAAQMKRIGPFSKRIQIDLMDGVFAQTKSVGLDAVWWPAGIMADIHMMHQKPMDSLAQLLHLKPHMVIIHAEADVHHMHMAAMLHKEGIEAGLAILPETTVNSIEDIISSFDHLLIFGGHLGHFGGKADLAQLVKAQEAIAHHPDLEIGWDGGVNDQNARQLSEGGIHVLNAGGFIQKSDDPVAAYGSLVQAIL